MLADKAMISFWRPESSVEVVIMLLDASRVLWAHGGHQNAEKRMLLGVTRLFAMM